MFSEGVIFMSSLGERLKIARNRKNLTQLEVYKRTKTVHNKTLSKYEKGDTTPDIKTLQLLADFYDVDFDWLIRGDEVKQNWTNQFVNEKIAEYKTNQIPLPVLGTIKAGQPLIMNKQYDEYEYVDKSTLKGRDAFILRVQGDSMSGDRDRIYDGDKVVVAVQNFAEPNDIAVVAVNGDEATLKRVKCQDEICMLIPSNPSMEPIIVPFDTIHILGKVIEHRRSFE
jgi:repressor LexA